VILYEAMVASLALLIGLGNIAWRDCKLRSNPQICFYVFCCSWDIYLCSLYAWSWNVVQHYTSC
jgi:hypothetical protein